MKKYACHILVLFALAFSLKSKATHLIGGFFSYECLGPVAGTNDVRYVLRAVLFKDSLNTGVGGAPGAVLENPLPVTLFNQANNNLIRTIDLPRDSLVILVDSGAGACVVGNPVVNIILKGYYSDTILLRRDRPHKYVWRRCCRNNPDNVVNPASSGSTFFIDIPEFDQVGCNTSPQLVAEQPFSFCAGIDINLDLSATDPDGDSIVYELCAPLDFPRASTGFTQVPANPPPYPLVVFQAPATAANPIPSNPAITIDPNTGVLTGVPTSTGKYLIGFCIKEYNNSGVLLSTTIRDIQVKVDNCILQVTSAIQDQERFCDGLTIQFRNRTSSNIDSTTIPYKWDFGVPSLTNDTSRLREPVYTFPAPGFYNITLIANPDNPECRDTSVTLFEVRPTLRTSIDVSDSNLCANNSVANFSVRGIFQPSATFQWDFGAATNINSSTNQVVNGVQFSGKGSYPVQLIVTQDNCDDTTNRIINVFNNPTADFTVNDGTGCSPFPVTFSSTVNIDGNAAVNYLWDFGDGNTSTLENPTNTYLNDGNYDVTLQVTTVGDCDDIITISKPNLVQTGPQFSNNNTDFSASPIAGCYPLDVQFTNLSTFDGTATYIWNFGDGSSSTDVNPIHQYTANGYYDVTLTMTTTGICAETLSLTTDSAIYISLDSSKNKVGFTVNQDTGCAPVEIQFTDTSIFEGAAKFKWYFGDGDSSELQNPLHVYQNDGIYDVELILETTEKCVDTLSLLKTAYIETDRRFSTNDVGFDFFPKEGCPPLTVQFSDSSKFLGIPQYFWDFGDGSAPNTNQNPTNTFTDTGKYSVGLLLITGDRCVDTNSTPLDSFIVTVLPKPLARINYADTSKSLKEANFEFTNDGSEFVNESRYLLDGTEIGRDSILNYQFLDTGRFQVAYVAINDLGCTDTSTADVFVFDEFEFIVPNVFTPNGDNINDEFKVRACGVYDYEIQIFNRFGEKVFESNSLNINWDGRVNGKQSNSGVYFYTIRIREFRNQILEYQGSITLLKE